MRRFAHFALAFCALTVAFSPALAADRVAGADDPDFKFQGEYQGTYRMDAGDEPAPMGLQLVAQGGGKFLVRAYPGGLPGEVPEKIKGWLTKAERQGDMVLLPGDVVHGELKNGVIKFISTEGMQLAEMKKVERKSPTLGAKPPRDAVVLFDGTGVDAFHPGAKMTPDKLLMAGVTSKQAFGDCQLHVEFRLPYMPTARGQACGNSGVYLQGRYEVQILDSFGLAGEDNECGAIYGIKSPDQNLCYPPLAWQTYDIDYTAARYENGRKVKNATITVKHNGFVVQDHVELPEATRAAPVAEGPQPGPLYLQDHGNPVIFRNLWLVERK